jgi:transcriptional regulator with XRE-family HTH domain
MARTRKQRDPADDALGKRLRQLRTARMMSQEALAEAANVQTAVVSRVERGVALPSLGTLRELAWALGVTMTELLAEDDLEAPPPSVDELLDGWHKLTALDQRLVLDLTVRLGRG